MNFIKYSYIVFGLTQAILVIRIVRKTLQLRRQKKLHDEK